MMNPDKARELFSAYYEDALDAGLRRALELRLSADVSLSSEYRAFKSTMDELDTLRFETIEAPIFLSDRIATRLEAERSKSKPKWNPFAAWTRGLAFASIAAVAIIGTVVTLNKSASGPGTSSLVNSAPNEVDYLVRNGQVVVKFTPSSDRSLVISVDGVRKTISPNAPSDVPLSNPNESASIFRILLERESNSTIIVIPGSKVPKIRVGSGSLEAFAKALADTYRVPVRVDAANTTASVAWSFEGSDPQKAATAALNGLGFTADSRPGGLICILDR